MLINITKLSDKKRKSRKLGYFYVPHCNHSTLKSRMYHHLGLACTMALQSGGDRLDKLACHTSGDKVCEQYAPCLTHAQFAIAKLLHLQGAAA